MTILTELFQIILLRRQPQDISHDSTAAIIAFFAAVATSYFSLIATNVFAQPLPFVLAQAIIQASIFYLLLSATSKQVRFTQTITALFGVAAILQFLSLITIKVPSLGLIGLMLTLWNFYLMVIILRDAIECKLFQAIIITILYHFVMGLILLMLFPDIYERMHALMTTAAEAS